MATKSTICNSLSSLVSVCPKISQGHQFLDNISNLLARLLIHPPRVPQELSWETTASIGEFTK